MLDDHSLEELIQSIKAYPAFSLLSPTALSTLCSSMTACRHKAGETILSLGQTNPQVFLIEKGVLACSVWDASIVQPIVSEFLKGPGIFYSALYPQSFASVEVTALSACQGFSIELEPFVHLIQNEPEFGLWLHNNLLARHLKTSSYRARSQGLSLEVRLAEFYWHLASVEVPSAANSYQAGRWINSKVSVQMIASYFGVSGDAVKEARSLLEDTGYIQFSGMSCKVAETTPVLFDLQAGSHQTGPWEGGLDTSLSEFDFRCQRDL